MTFKRSSFERQLTFQEIMDATELSKNDVELIVMKAVSKGLVKGRIDQVAEKVYMTWVQPRVLDIPQVCLFISNAIFLIPQLFVINPSHYLQLSFDFDRLLP